MNSWTPIYSTIVDSSLWDEPDYVCKVFITMLAIKDFRDHVVRTTAYGLARKCWPRDEDGLGKVEDALKRLSSPDPKRPGQPLEGRRIEKVEDGYLVLNGELYQAMIRKYQRRAYKTEKEAEYRKRRKPGVRAEKLEAQCEGAQQAIAEGMAEANGEASPHEVRVAEEFPSPPGIPDEELPEGFR